MGASQEHKVKPKKFAQTDIDEVILGHTNEPEYRRLQNNEFMEALRDRTVKIDIPYVTRLSNEIKIYEKDYNPDKVPGKHIAPHTIEMAAMWAVLTRLEEPKNASLTLMQKLKLYNGKSLPGFTEENIKELKEEAVQAKACRASRPATCRTRSPTPWWHVPRSSSSINPFMVMNELESGLKHHSLITNEDCEETLPRTSGHGQRRVREHRQERSATGHRRRRRRAQASVRQLHRQHQGYTRKSEKVKNKFTGQYEEPDERLMRSIEEKIDIPDSRKDDFRREIMNYIGALSIDGKTFDYKTNERLLQGPRAQAVRGPEGHDQAHELGVERRRRRNASQRSTS